ncbi:MAG: serine/threonine-protein kinase [Planctomycetota bacterium]
MANQPDRRPRKKARKIAPAPGKAAPEPAKPRSKPPVDEGTETTPDTRLVNAMESNPEFFKDPLIGQRVGKCKIEKYLGEGKTAIVYRAHYEPLNRTVAVKVLQPHMTKIPAVLRVFQQEGKAVAILDHENILKIYDVGEDRGHYYMVLELLRGKDLLKVLEDAEGGTVDLETALDYTKQAARGLAAAHRKKLVHRDIKPQNLLLEPGGSLKIVDFGLAAEAEGAFAGGRLGTPHYMAPEQCRGEGAVTETDVYALGITLFHLLIGSPPFSGRKSKEEIIEGHLKGIRFEPERINKKVPRAAGDLIRRMTRMEASARPSAREVIELIEGFKSDRGKGVPAGRARASRRAATKSKNSTGLLVGAGAVVLALVLFLLMQGGKDEGKETTGTAQPRKIVKKRKPKRVSGKQKPDKPVKVDQTDEERFATLFKEAETEEAAKNYVQAHGMYSQIAIKAPAGSDWAKRAKARAEELVELINVKRGKKRTRKKIITIEMHRKAISEFKERLVDYPAYLMTLRVAEVRNEIKRFLENTRPDSPEKTDMERYLVRVGYVDGLLGMAVDRAQSLAGDKLLWDYYDPTDPGDTVVIGAHAGGVKLKDTETDIESTLEWSDISATVLVRFFDALRNKDSATENFWLGYFCLLTDNDSASLYFDFAKLKDPGPEMAQKIAAVQNK